MPPLRGVGVLVTRPLAQSQSLCALLEAQGARTWRLPVLEIRGIDASPVRGPFDLVLFTSANAVRHADLLLPDLADASVAAIGPATTRALQAAGRSVDVQPLSGVDSEALLAHPRLAALAGQRVLLVKGRGGRELLQRALQDRGAHLQVAEVYERVPIPADADALSALERHAAAGQVHAIVVTSVDIGTRLLEVLPPALRRALGSALWIVPSARVAAALQAQGLEAPIRLARAADDQGLLAALLESRGPSTA